jgi:uncharacterized protein DUF3179
MATQGLKAFRSRYAFITRRLLTTVVPPKPLYERLRPGLDRMGLRWDRSELPYLYRLAPLQTARDCAPLIDPPMVPAAEAAHMRENDDVIALAVNGEARAYPWWVLDNHHVANDVIGGQPVVISLCEMCSSGMAFDSRVNGRRLLFRATHVYMGTTAIQDRQTKSVWSPYLLRAITGPLRGSSLSLLPAQQMRWSAWRERHPGTLVLPGYLGSRVGHGSAHTLGSERMSPDMRRMVPHWDPRLPHNVLVLGLIHGGEQRAYPLSVLKARAGVVNDAIAGAPVVVMADSTQVISGALAFSREVAGRTLTFVPVPDGALDVETGSRWSFEGGAVDGPLAGTQLAFVDSHVSEWFIWAAHYPEIQLILEPPEAPVADRLDVAADEA